MLILDYSAGYPGARAIKAAGYGGVIRYLRKEGTSTVRPITAAELADMRAHGLAVALVYQAVSTGRILEGRAAGEHDARWALARATDIGADPRCIYFAADRDVQAGQVPAVLAYLDGAAAVLGRHRVGVYGHAGVVDAAVPAHAAYGWQTAAWSRGRLSPRAHLFQRIGTARVGGVSCDINDVRATDFGQLDTKEATTVSWTDPITFTPPGTSQPVTYSAAQWLTWANFYSGQTAAELAGLRAAVERLAGAVAGDPLTADQLKAAVRDGIAESVVRVDVNVHDTAPTTEGPAA